jgi:hypothetical protein
MSHGRGPNYREEHAAGIEDRAELKLDPCAKCKERGHYCKAIGDGNELGERLCIFCMDGVECSYEAISRQSRTAQPGHWLPPAKPIRPRQLRSSNSPKASRRRQRSL